MKIIFTIIRWKNYEGIWFLFLSSIKQCYVRGEKNLRKTFTPKWFENLHHNASLLSVWFGQHSRQIRLSQDMHTNESTKLDVLKTSLAASCKASDHLYFSLL